MTDLAPELQEVAVTLPDGAVRTYRSGVTGAAIGGPYVLRTGFSTTGLVAISTFGSALATLCVATVRTLATRQSGLSLTCGLSRARRASALQR